MPTLDALGIWESEITSNAQQHSSHLRGPELIIEPTPSDLASIPFPRPLALHLAAHADKRWSKLRYAAPTLAGRPFTYLFSSLATGPHGAPSSLATEPRAA
jgi:hypothetical protein